MLIFRSVAVGLVALSFASIAPAAEEAAAEAPQSPHTFSANVGLYYSPDYFGEDGDAVYTYGTFGLSLPYDFSPYVTLGYQYVDGDQTSGPEGYKYFHYAIGISKKLGIFTADLSWQDARDLDDCDHNCTAVVFSVSSSW